MDWILAPKGVVSWMLATAISIIFLFMAVIALSVLYKKILKISNELQNQTPKTPMEISGPTNVRVVQSSTRGLQRLLPPHISVPMGDERHEALYEAYYRSAGASRSGLDLGLQEGMSENPDEIPTPFIDEEEL